MQCFQGADSGQASLCFTHKFCCECEIDIKCCSIDHLKSRLLSRTSIRQVLVEFRCCWLVWWSQKVGGDSTLLCCWIFLSTILLIMNLFANSIVPTTAVTESMSALKCLHGISKLKIYLRPSEWLRSLIDYFKEDINRDDTASYVVK